MRNLLRDFAVGFKSSELQAKANQICNFWNCHSIHWPDFISQIPSLWALTLNQFGVILCSILEKMKSFSWATRNAFWFIQSTSTVKFSSTTIQSSLKSFCACATLQIILRTTNEHDSISLTNHSIFVFEATLLLIQQFHFNFAFLFKTFRSKFTMCAICVVRAFMMRKKSQWASL